VIVTLLTPSEASVGGLFYAKRFSWIRLILETKLVIFKDFLSNFD